MGALLLSIVEPNVRSSSDKIKLIFMRGEIWI